MAKSGKRNTNLTIDAATGHVERPPKVRDRTRLDTSEDVLQEMRRLYRRAKGERQDVTRLVWILGEIRKAMELVEVTAQVERLKLMYQRFGAPDASVLPAPELEPTGVTSDDAHRYVGD